jgi:hypothetical protein
MTGGSFPYPDCGKADCPVHDTVKKTWRRRMTTRIVGHQGECIISDEVAVVGQVACANNPPRGLHAELHIRQHRTMLSPPVPPYIFGRLWSFVRTPSLRSQ